MEILIISLLFFLGISHLTTAQLNRSLEILCLFNCPDFDVSVDLEVTAACHWFRNCNFSEGEQYTWTLNPPSKFETSGDLSEKLTILKGSYPGGMLLSIDVAIEDLEASYNLTSKAECSVEPSRGTINDLFSLKCGYQSDVKVEVYQQASDSIAASNLLYKGTIPTKLSLTEGHPNRLRVVIPEVQHTIQLEVYVSSPSSADNSANIIAKLFGDKPSDLPQLIKDKSYDQVRLTTLELLEQLSQQNEDRIKWHLRRHILAVVLLIADHVESHHLKTILHTALHPYYVADASSLAMLSEILLLYTERIEKESSASPDLYDGATFVVNASSAILSSSLNICRLHNGHDDDNDEEEGDCHAEVPSEGLLDPSKMVEEKDLNNVAGDLIRIMDMIGRLHVDEMYLENISEGSIASLVYKVPWRSFEPVSLQLGGSGLDFPQNLMYRLRFLPGPQFIHLAIFQKNPFWWNSDGKDIKTDVMMASLFTEHKNITTLKETISLKLRREPLLPQTIIGHMNYSGPIMRVYRLTVREDAQITIDFSDMDNTFYFLLSYSYPSIYDVIEKGRPMARTAPSNKLVVDRAESAVVYAAVVRKLGYSLNFTMVLSQLACMHWVPGGQWRTQGCAVGPGTSDSQLECLCSHLSLFAGMFSAPDCEEITLQALEVDLDIRTSTLMVTVVLTILGAWALIMVYAAYKDIELSRRVVRVLSDTVPSDRHAYLVCVTTGVWQGSGTTANVAFQLHGSRSSSRIHLLKEHGMLREGCEDWFILRTPQPLGVVRAVRLFHDSLGSHPHWFCQKVEVLDLSAQRRYTFNIRQWLSLVRGRGEVILVWLEQSLQPPKDGASVRQRIWDDMRDLHTTMSIVTRPQDSTFTTKERAATCAATMLFGMLINAVQYDLISTSGLDVSFSVKFTTANLIIMAQTVLATLPVNLILTTLFRRSSPSTTL